MADNPRFAFLNDINYGKVGIPITPENRKDYNKFLINGFLSQHIDTIMLAQEMASRPNISLEAHYAFLLHSVRKAKRFSTFPKAAARTEDGRLLAEYYGISYRKAMGLLSCHTPEQMEAIRSSYSPGGRVEKRKGKKESPA